MMKQEQEQFSLLPHRYDHVYGIYGRKLEEQGKQAPYRYIRNTFVWKMI